MQPFTSNPETFRDWQYARYQSMLGDECAPEPLRCQMCGEEIAPDEEFELTTLPGRPRYVCRLCVEVEAEEHGGDMTEAIRSLGVQVAEYYRKAHGVDLCTQAFGHSQKQSQLK